MMEFVAAEAPPAGLHEWVEPTLRFTPGLDPLYLRA